TGTEVLTGRVSDRNGPWLADRLLELGVDVAQTAIVADRPQELLATLRFFAELDVDLVITSGGLGPTADDLTAEVVAAFQERPLMLDEALEGRIAEILRPLAARFPDLDIDAVRAGNAKQALIPRGATVLEPVGTAPGLVVPPPEGSPGGPTVVVLPGPPRELQPMWGDAVVKDAFRAATAGAGDLRQQTLRLFGIPESEIAATLRRASAEGVELDRLEVTTCLRRGEVEVVTRFAPAAQQAYDALAQVVRERHADTLFSDDGRSVDELVLDALRGPPARRIAVAESCTGGLLSARLTERAGSSEVVAGGLVVYANEAKVALAGVDPGLIGSCGAVSVEVARALASGACDRFGSDVGVGVTGVAGPTGGTEDKPVGTVCLSAVLADGGGALTHRVTLPGARFDVRDRSTTVALHLVRRLLAGERD
ncbi:MAG: competence/damage-inducible protein A, partial [Actinomycetota bacterium]|nr:competence/damage-inducible protein A [Actinomycetota bacterium]